MGCLSDRSDTPALPTGEPPRWVLLFNNGQVLLVDRNKWAQKRMLRFDLAAILANRDDGPRRALAALLHHDSVTPSEGTCLLDTLGENSHKQAFSVSQDLKYSAREAVELLGNEVVWYLRETHQGILKEIEANDLTRECLRYLYRLLFLFFVEARPELGYAPMKSEEYRTGYSLESLRDVVEQGDLTTEESRNGYYLHDSITMLFDLVWNGIHDKDTQLDVLEQTSDIHVFRMKPLQGDVFNPAFTPLLSRMKFRNSVLQRVLELLSLSRPQAGRSRGRISYRELGINQLGAVYEGLLSYTGFFVREKDGIYEVKKAGESADPLKQAYFVRAADLAQYDAKEEVVYDDQGRPKWYPQGTFIYRLAGRNRQKSASYYTPEVLTQCVVKYALKELLKDKAADQILDLTICEPALGSGAFLNEALNQLADAYLDRKRKETHCDIPHNEIEREKQRVKAWMADNRVFGVDLNPVAVELAQISLWLNTIYEGHTIPWFGAQLAVGNSLIGARRQVFAREQITGKERAWLEAVPDRVKPGETRAEGAVYHWLLPDSGMANYTDKAVKQMTGDATKRIGQWRREFSARFTEGDAKALGRLSAAVDKLWKKHVEDLRSIRARTAPAFPIFGQEDNPAFRSRGDASTTQRRNEVWRGILHPRPWSSPYERLQLAMDYWCALWFWPSERPDLLPTRDQFLFELSAILEGTVQGAELMRPEQGALFDDGTPRQQQLEVLEDHGQVDLEALVERSERLKLVREIAGRQRFLHRELEFADVFEDRGGFDLILGNPPWVKIEWNEGAVMGDFEPLYVLRDYSAPRLDSLRANAVRASELLRTVYLLEYEEYAGTQNFLNAGQNHPLLVGGQSNTYKCFIEESWYLASQKGVQAFLHQEGPFEDPNGARLRAAIYPRLKLHLGFRNERNLFSDVLHTRTFCVTVCGNPGPVRFDHISGLFHPGTVDECYDSKGGEVCPGIKTEDGKWDVAGHRDRIISVDSEMLSLFGRLYDSDGTPASESRLPSLHTKGLVRALRALADFPRKLGDISSEYSHTEMWHETNAVMQGTIRRETRFPADAGDWVMSGPHIGVANPFYKTPRRDCDVPTDYDPPDLTELPLDYLPRTNYVPACSREEYAVRIPRVSWGDRASLTSFYRFIARKMMGQTGERALIAAIAPREVGHIDGCTSTAFQETAELPRFAAMAASLTLDFFMKTTGKSNLRDELLKQFPLVDDATGSLTIRSLLSICLTAHYGDLWRECFDQTFTSDRWAKSDPRLADIRFSLLTSNWQWSTPLRTDYERRQALIEIDVLAAMELGLTLNELRTIYRIQFPVLRQNEQDTWYDRGGRIVFTCSKALPGVGFSRTEWEKIRDMPSGTVSREIDDDTLPGGPRKRVVTYEAPFDRCDREEDYKTAWAEFEIRRAAAHGAEA
jgi:type I restriction-modification system DNA methylase subunit